jgi:hypothetical protein
MFLYSILSIIGTSNWLRQYYNTIKYQSLYTGPYPKGG